ncbi:MAG: aldose 1-epimerase [Oscillospiraceae bacterium]|jgi:aldose 1-epimerase|nr:aldose 1-epimerase [Oscillospiraceae bacterium]
MPAFTAQHGALPPHGLDVWMLSGAGHEVRILPEMGFNLYYWTYEGREILMEPVDILVKGSKYGIPLLFPTPNRMRDARFVWRGKQYAQRKRGVDVRIHGLVMDEPWAVRCWAEEGAACAEGTIEIAPGNALHEAFPFPCRLTVRYTLRAEGLLMEAKVENIGADDLPFGFAIHPYFSKRGDASQVFLTAPLARIYENDENLLPSGRLLPARGTRWDASGGWHSVQSLDLDHVYHGMTEDLCARIRYPGSVQVTLRGDDSFRNLIVFTPKDRPGFCIEHQTCATDALNLHARGLLQEAGLLVLPAGQAWNGWVRLDVAVDNEN